MHCLNQLVSLGNYGEGYGGNCAKCANSAMNGVARIWEIR